MKGGLAPQLHRDYCPPLRPGQEWWTDTPHRLAQRIRVESGTGRVLLLGWVELAPGFHGALVRRLKPRPPAWRKPLLISVGLGLMLVSIVALVLSLAASVARSASSSGGAALSFALVAGALAFWRVRRKR